MFTRTDIDTFEDDLDTQLDRALETSNLVESFPRVLRACLYRYPAIAEALTSSETNSLVEASNMGPWWSIRARLLSTASA